MFEDAKFCKLLDHKYHGQWLNSSISQKIVYILMKLSFYHSKFTKNIFSINIFSLNPMFFCLKFINLQTYIFKKMKILGFVSNSTIFLWYLLVYMYDMNIISLHHKHIYKYIYSYSFWFAETKEIICRRINKKLHLSKQQSI